MKSRTDAAKALLARGWTPTEIAAILGDVPGLNTSSESRTASPWWTYVGDDQYSNGSPLIEELYAWLEQGKNS